MNVSQERIVHALVAFLCCGLTSARCLYGQTQLKVDSKSSAETDKEVWPKSLHDLPLVFQDDFESGSKHWETTDSKNWQITMEESGNHVFGLRERKSNYEPRVRSPHNIALVKELELTDVVISYRVRSTLDTGGHRDCCTFFAHKDAEHFYYAHLGARPDPASGQIMIVDGKPRRPLTQNEKLVPWDDNWHLVKIHRDSKSGTISVYFDNMDEPHMVATDTTFGKGRVGIGSFDDKNDFDDVYVYGR